MADPESSVLGAGVELRGNVRGSEDLTLDGSLHGTLTLEHHLNVSTTGGMHGEAHVVSTSVAGHASGKITAKDFIQLLPGAKVTADLCAPRIILEEGCHFVGKVEMTVNMPKDLNRPERGRPG